MTHPFVAGFLHELEKSAVSSSHAWRAALARVRRSGSAGIFDKYIATATAPIKGLDKIPSYFRPHVENVTGAAKRDLRSSLREIQHDYPRHEE